MGRACLCAPRDCAQQIRGRRAARQRGCLCRRTRQIARTTALLSFPPTVCQRRCQTLRLHAKWSMWMQPAHLVSKVHIEAQRHSDNGLQMIMIGHEGHPETVGHNGAVARRRGRAWSKPPKTSQPWPCGTRQKLAYVTQTTLSVDDTADIVAALARSLSQNRRPTQGRHLLRHHQPSGGCQSNGAQV